MGKEGIVNGKDVPNYGLSNYRKMVWLWKRNGLLWVKIVVKKESAVRKKSNNRKRRTQMKVNVKRKREE